MNKEDINFRIELIDKCIRMCNRMIGRFSDFRNIDNMDYIKNKKKEFERMKEKIKESSVNKPYTNMEAKVK